MSLRGEMSRRKFHSSSRRRRTPPEFPEDVLLHIFSFIEPADLARSMCVCKFWYDIIGKLPSRRYYYLSQKSKHYGYLEGVLPAPTSREWLKSLAGPEHKAALSNGSVQLRSWNGHSKGVNCCKIGMETVLTGVGDMAVRVWSLSTLRCVEEYTTVDKAPLIDLDFDESKVVGLVGKDICIWKRHGSRQTHRLCRGSVEQAYCLCYSDPEAAIGCWDGTIRIFDMYSSRFSRIFRQHSGAVSCLSLIDDQSLLSGSSLGKVSVYDASSGQTVASLRSSSTLAGISCLWVNKDSFQVYAGNTSGYANCWDIRTYRQLWGERISPNVIYSMSSNIVNPSVLVLGGIDGILNILDADTGQIVSKYVPTAKMGNVADGMIARCRASKVIIPIDKLPKSTRRPITCVAVGLQKAVTTHNDKSIMIWNFKRQRL